jgi:outer membrane protein assembly factor BamB
MSRLVLRILSLSFCLCLGATSATPPSLEPRWEKEFPNEISWYVRTSPGILLVRSGRSLTAVDGADGRELWKLPDIGSTALTGSDVDLTLDRGRNLLEVPGLGLLLLNGAKFPGDSNRRLVALKLSSGERLWDQDEADHLMSVHTLGDTGEILLTATRLQKKVAAGQAAASAAMAVAPFGAGWGLMPLLLNPNPSRLEFQRLDALNGKAQWRTEYPHTILPLAARVTPAGDYFIVTVGDGLLASLELSTGNRKWEEGESAYHNFKFPAPVLYQNGRVIYATKYVGAVNPGTQHLYWGIGKLGKVTGALVYKGTAVGLGSEHIAAVDAETGRELWRRATHGHTTNLLWDKPSDTILYVDGKGLHSVERQTGKPQLDASLHSESYPELITLASPDVVVTIATDLVSAYNRKTGQKLFDAGRPISLFSSCAVANTWPIAPQGEEFHAVSELPPSSSEGQSAVKDSLFPPEWQDRVIRNCGEGRGTDAFETESETGFRQTWWIDSKTNRKIEFGVAGKQHDVSRSSAMIYAVDGKRIWGAAIPAN